MSEYRAASRYAKSLLELAEEKGVLEEVHKDMRDLHKLCEDSRDFVLMLKNPVIKSDKKQAVLEKIFKGKVNEMTIAIFEIIARKNRASIIPAIAIEFHHQYNLVKGIAEAKVTTAIPLGEDLRDQIKDLVRKISAKKEVELTEVVDNNIIGGYILKVGDRQIDDSLKSKLKALELRFSQNPYIKEF